MASEEASILFALEQQENEEEERWIAEEKSVVEEEEAEEMRLEEMRLEAEKEADEARKAAEVAQSSWTIYVNMTEDSEWSPMSPYLMSLVMLQLLEQENCAEGSGRGSEQGYVDAGKSRREEERTFDSGETSLLALQACRASEGLCLDWVSQFFLFFVDFFLPTYNLVEVPPATNA